MRSLRRVVSEVDFKDCVNDLFFLVECLFVIMIDFSEIFLLICSVLLFIF